MLEKFPYCGLKGKPHIESKIKILKRQLGYILEIQKQASGSGFGWDDELKMITGEKEMFMGWAQVSIVFVNCFVLYVIKLLPPCLSTAYCLATAYLPTAYELQQ